LVATGVDAVTGVILAAGRGSRLLSLTDDRPKGLVKVGGRSLVEWQLDALRGAHIESLAIVTGYCQNDYEPFGVRTIHNERWADTNMVASMLRALEVLDGTILFSYSDILYDPAVVQRLLQSEADFAVAYDTQWLDIWSQRFSDPLSDAESFKIGADGKILEIGQAAHDVKDIQGQFMGLFKVSARAAGWIRKLLAEQGAGVDALDTTGLLNLMITRGLSIVGVPTTGNWMEVDDQNDLKLAESMMHSGTLALGDAIEVGS
jgi:choline kinase